MTTQDIILGGRGAGKTKDLMEKMTPEQRKEYVKILLESKGFSYPGGPQNGGLP